MIKLGINNTISIDEYHADRKYISSSGLKEAFKSAKHFELFLNKPYEKKSHFDFGNAFELALLDVANKKTTLEKGSEFIKYVSVFDESKKPESNKNFGSSKNKAWKDDFYIENILKYIINKNGNESEETILKMVESCVEQPYIIELLSESNYQSSLFWKDDTSRILLKSRPDIVKSQKKIVVDIKTSKSANHHDFAKDCAVYNYPLQAFMQIEGILKTGLLSSVETYYWLAVEKTEPYNAQLYEFQKKDWDAVSEIYYSALRTISRSRMINRYEGYFERSENQLLTIPLELPLWYYQK